MTLTLGAATSARRQRPLRGIAFLCLGALSFSLHDVGIKAVAGTYPLSEAMFIRSFTALPIIALLVHWDSGLRALLDKRIGLILIRAFLLLAGYLSYYLAFAALPFADAVALYSTVPLFVVVLAGPFLGETVGLVRWIAVLVGLAGVVVMMQPGSGLFEPAGLLILLCAFLYSVSMVMARSMGATISAAVMTFYSTLMFLVAAAALGLVLVDPARAVDAHPSVAFLFRPWAVPSWPDLLLMLSCGVTAAGGIMGLTAAYREADANLVTSFEYTALIWAAVWGFVFFGEVPTGTTFVGAALVVMAGLAALYPMRRTDGTGGR
jgi:drug/metabolite transporter (DMT)-like permease